MFDALTYQKMLKEIKKNSEKYGITDDMVAILITRPDLATGKDILNSLEYYHFRTGRSINFYLPGYVIKKNCLINVKISCLTIQLESC